jgi:hypothetical protein
MDVMLILMRLNSLLDGRIPDERDGLSREIVMDLRCVKILNTQGSWIDGSRGSGSRFVKFSIGPNTNSECSNLLN